MSLPRLSSIRSRMLAIALLPALVTEFGMVAYFTRQAFATAEDALHARAANAARHLAGTLPYALAGGDAALAHALLEAETGHSQLAFARVSDARGQIVASTGAALHADTSGDITAAQRDSPARRRLPRRPPVRRRAPPGK